MIGSEEDEYTRMGTLGGGGSSVLPDGCGFDCKAAASISTPFPSLLQINTQRSPTSANLWIDGKSSSRFTVSRLDHGVTCKPFLRSYPACILAVVLVSSFPRFFDFPSTPSPPNASHSATVTP